MKTNEVTTITPCNKKAQRQHINTALRIYTVHAWFGVTWFQVSNFSNSTTSLETLREFKEPYFCLKRQREGNLPFPFYFRSSCHSFLKFGVTK